MRVEGSRGDAQATPDLDGAVPADPDEVLLLVEDATTPETASYASPRHRLADRAAQWLADPPRGRSGESFAAEVDVPVRMIPGLAQVLRDAPEVVADWPASAVRVARGRGGVVIRVHGDAWSVVFRVGGRVLVVLDSMADTALRVDRDEDWAPEVAAMVEGVLRELDRRAPGGDRHPAS